MCACGLAVGGVIVLYLRADGLLNLVLPEGVHASAKLVHAPKNTRMPRPSIVCGLYVGVKAVKLQLDLKVKMAPI